MFFFAVVTGTDFCASCSYLSFCSPVSCIAFPALHLEHWNDAHVFLRLLAPAGVWGLIRSVVPWVTLYVLTCSVHCRLRFLESSSFQCWRLHTCSWLDTLKCKGWNVSALPSDVWALLCRVLTQFSCAGNKYASESIKCTSEGVGAKSTFEAVPEPWGSIVPVVKTDPMQGQRGQSRMRRGYSGTGWKKSPLLLRVWTPKFLFPLWIVSIQRRAPLTSALPLATCVFSQPNFRIIGKAVKRTFDISFIKRISCCKLPQVINYFFCK